MPILADLSRRLFMLTTDAKPDPPRVGIEGNSRDSSRRNSEKTAPTTADIDPATDNNTRLQHERINRQKSMPEGCTGDTSKQNSGERKNAKFRTKPTKNGGQSTNIVNYNIVGSSGVKIGATTTYVCNINQYVGTPKKKPTFSNETAAKQEETKVMPESIKSLVASKKEIEIEDMFLVKTHVGSSWREVFKSLNYSEGHLDVLEANHNSKGLDEVIYQALLDWKQASGKEAKIGILVNALWRCKQYDCVERLALARKEY